jgi:hypothetical protein
MFAAHSPKKLTTSESKLTEVKLVEKFGFESHVQMCGKEPKSILIRDPDNRVVIQFNTDAIDCMGFTNIDLASLSLAKKEAAIVCLVETLKTCYGGKNLFAVPAELVDLCKKYGLDTIPRVPSGNVYGRLMTTPVDQFGKNLESLIAEKKDAIAALRSEYKLVDAKALNLEAMSDLYIKNAEYASRADKIAGYTPTAMQHRFTNPNVYTFALQNKEAKTVAAMRVYIEPGVGAYVSDLVTDKEQRHKGLALLLLQEAHKVLKDKIADGFLIAGDDSEAKFYHDALGCQSVAELTKSEPLVLAGKKVFMFALIPQQKLLKEFLESMPVVVAAKDNSKAAPESAAACRA